MFYKHLRILISGQHSRRLKVSSRYVMKKVLFEYMYIKKEICYLHSKTNMSPPYRGDITLCEKLRMIQLSIEKIMLMKESCILTAAISQAFMTTPMKKRALVSLFAGCLLICKKSTCSSYINS